MKYKVTLENVTDMKDIQRDLKHCRVKYTIGKNFCDYTPGFDGFTLTFTTKNKKILEYIGFNDEQIKEFRDYNKKPLKEDIEIPF